MSDGLGSVPEPELGIGKGWVGRIASRWDGWLTGASVCDQEREDEERASSGSRGLGER